jgi:hypothetical protein
MEPSDLAADPWQAAVMDIEMWVCESRKAQGLPPTIEDEATVVRILIIAGLTPANAQRLPQA